jgi:hypothetical protein
MIAKETVFRLASLAIVFMPLAFREATLGTTTFYCKKTNGICLSPITVSICPNGTVDPCENGTNTTYVISSDSICTKLSNDIKFCAESSNQAK